MHYQTEYRGRKIISRREGTGKSVVFLHGFCEDSALWNGFVNALKSQYTVITLDLSGFGKSDLIEDYTIKNLAESVHVVLQEQQIEDYVLIGHSMGGYVAAAHLAAYGKHIRGIGLFHSHAFSDSEEKKKNRQKSIEFIQKHGVTPFVSHLFSSLFAPAFCAAEPAIVEDFIDQASHHHSDAVIAASWAMLQRPDHSQTLAQAQCPILFIIGEQDTSIPLALCLEQTSLPDKAQICILPGVGHIGMVEAPERTLVEVELFLEWCWR